MMESVISLLLVATVASIGVAAAGILIIPWIPQPDWGRFAGRWGIRCACLFSAVLAGLLASQPQTEITTAATGLWTVFSLEEPRPLSLDFGFQATWSTAALVTLAGGLFLLWEKHLETRDQRPLTDKARLANRLLYLAITTFFLSPNFHQSLFSWGCLSLLGFLAIRLTPPTADPAANEKPESICVPQQGDSFATSWPPIGRMTTSATSSFRDTPSFRDTRDAPGHQESGFLGGLSRLLDRISRSAQQGWTLMTATVPNLLGEQAEFLEESPDSVQLLATTLGLFSILLTWLLVS
jgi:hypothetical protein